MNKQAIDTCPNCKKNMKLFGFDYVKCPLGHTMTVEAAEYIRSLEAENEKMQKAIKDSISLNEP